MWRNSIIATLLVVITISSFGQYGNEWIDANQSYFKFKIAEDGFYRITQSELQSAGFPIGSVPSGRIQLFREGQEVAINVNANGDGTLNYLEFYGQKKDGNSDASLYENGDQPHIYHNLFTDSASYFLTYLPGSGSGKRMGFSSDKDATGLTPEPYHLADTIQILHSNYTAGVRFGVGNAFSLSRYVEAEGWTGPSQRKNAFSDFVFTLSNLESDTDITLESVLVGRNGLNHNVNFQAGENSSDLNSLGNVEFSAYGFTNYTEIIPPSSIGAAGELTVRTLTEGFPDAEDRVSISFVRIEYPQTISMTSGQNKLFGLDDPTIRRAWVQIETTNASGTRIFNVTDPYNAITMATTNFSDRVEVVVPDVSSGNKLLAVTNTKSVGNIQPVTFPNYDLEGSNYLIITHPDLRNGGDPINDYKNYRESSAGGGYSVEVAEILDLYDMFGFGDPTPMAIYNFIDFANAQNGVSHVFIIGKGFTVNVDYYRGDQSGVNIPTFGFPGTDLMYTVGINASSILPGIPIGRLNATSSDQVTAYLNKVIEMEALPFDDLFRKDFLQLSGGFSDSEIVAFVEYVKGFTEVLEEDFIGGRAFNTGKETIESVEFIDVSDRVNQGVGYITFFGHSSGSVTDIEIGRVSEPEFGYSNKGKYPIILVNGCQAGEIFGSNFTFGEDWTLEPDLGAVGFLAHTGTALASTLRLWSNLYYDVSFGDDVFIGSTIGEALVEISNRYFTQFGTSDLNQTQVHQMQLQGDPAYRVFGADSPDYQIDSNSIIASAIEADEILAAQDTFRIQVVVKNFGRTVTDSLTIQVNRVYPDGAMDTYEDNFIRPLRQDTLEFLIPNSPTRNNAGINQFTVLLDPLNVVEEMDESNNSATLEVSIFDGNTIHLYPLDNGTESDDLVEFIWQSSNPLEEARSYELEVDTDPGFSSPNSRSFVTSGEVLLNQTFDFSTFSLPDTTTIYWRTRFQDPNENESNDWTNSSFTLIENVEEGWGQYEPDQMNDGNMNGIEFNETSNDWEFIETTNPVEIFTFGSADTLLNSTDVRVNFGGVEYNISDNIADPFCFDDTFNAMVFDRQSGLPYNPVEKEGNDEDNDDICGRLPQRIYQFLEDGMIGSERKFGELVNQMSNGDMIVMFNIGNVDYSNWDAEVINSLGSLGVSSTTISSLTDGQPVIFLGRKGDAPGLAIEIVNNGSATPVTEQSIEMLENVFGSFTSGQVRTLRIGPARDWNSFSYRISEEPADNLNLNLLGVTPDGNTDPLVSRTISETIDVSTIDPIQYPQLELIFDFEDETNQTPPQLDFWEINYAYPPEGLLLPVSREVQSYSEGAQISRALRFVNVSEVDFTDSLTVMSRMINQSSGTIQESSFQIAPPSTNDTTSFVAEFPSFEMAGLNSLIVEVQANENEVYEINNRITLTSLIDVQADETNPIIDVTFDGYHILDGDIVSPNPMIAVQMRDDNPFALKSDTTGLNIFLRLPGETAQFQRVNFSDPRLTFIPATENQDANIEYQPGPLEDGIHTLRVRAEDEAGNEAGLEPFEINFEVINESTVTHFYPYPNPFSTSCRFVFTLTGSEIPDEIKIQIMTVSGRVVREITQDEIGPIRIGNNITSYAWDGRDEYGDQLANGVYFYKVFINSNGNRMTQRATSADRAFKNGFGKLYILR